MSAMFSSAAVAKQFLASQDVGFGECAALRRDFDVALFEPGETQHHGGIHDRQQIVDFKRQSAARRYMSSRPL